MYDNRINEMEIMESMGAMMEEVAEELAFEADMATDPYGDASWADKMEAEADEWIFVGKTAPCFLPIGYTEYVNTSGTVGKRIWFDGYVETYEL